MENEKEDDIKDIKLKMFNLFLLINTIKLYKDNENFDNLYLKFNINLHMPFGKIYEYGLVIEEKNNIIYNVYKIYIDKNETDIIEIDDLNNAPAYFNNHILIDILIENDIVLYLKNNFLNKFKNCKEFLNCACGYIPMRYIHKLENIHLSLENEIKLLEYTEI